jgi:uncharacterized protein YjbI with pentapeptide repeats
MGKCSYTWEELDMERGNVERRCQEETWKSSDEFCIFHDLSREKDKDLFEKKLYEKLESRDFNFRGYCFVGDLKFRNRQFDENVNFEDAVFWGKMSFKNSIFQDAEFKNAKFRESVEFEGADLKSVSFRGTSFCKYSNFSKMHSGYADFMEAIFAYTNFSNATFQGQTFFQKSTFEGAADFSDVDFQIVNFSTAIFKENALFDGSKFRNAYFRETIFHRKAGFCKATFQEFATFIKATFQSAEFVDTTFQKVDFGEAIIERNMNLSPSEVGVLNLRKSQFFFKGRISADLRKALFYEAELRNVVFVNCTWPDNHVIYEEEHMKEEDPKLSFHELEAIYRDLKQNMQNHGDYVRAGELYYREMEMRRKGTSLKSWNRLWSELYRFLAGYGEKPYLVVRNSFLVILLAAVLFFFCGVARVGTELPPQENPDIIDYSIHSLTLSIETLKDFGYCLYYSVVTFTTLGYGDIHPLGCNHVFASLESLLGAFFMALFVVVFARKMMR